MKKLTMFTFLVLITFFITKGISGYLISAFENNGNYEIRKNLIKEIETKSHEIKTKYQSNEQELKIELINEIELKKRKIKKNVPEFVGKVNSFTFSINQIYTKLTDKLNHRNRAEEKIIKTFNQMVVNPDQLNTEIESMVNIYLKEVMQNRINYSKEMELVIKQRFETISLDSIVEKTFYEKVLNKSNMLRLKNVSNKNIAKNITSTFILLKAPGLLAKKTIVLLPIILAAEWIIDNRVEKGIVNKINNEIDKCFNVIFYGSGNDKGIIEILDEINSKNIEWRDQFTDNLKKYINKI